MFSVHTHTDTHERARSAGKGMGWGVGFLSFAHPSVRESLRHPQRAQSLSWISTPPSPPR